MNEPDAPLTERQARMMAYVDDELDADARRAFEQELAEDPVLAVEVAEYEQLLDLSRSLPLLEPTDHDMRRFWGRYYNRVEWRLGWVLLALGAIVLAATGLIELLLLDLPWHVRVAIVFAFAGGAIVLCSTLRQRARAHRLDRYRGVLR